MESDESQLLGTDHNIPGFICPEEIPWPTARIRFPCSPSFPSPLPPLFVRSLCHILRIPSISGPGSPAEGFWCELPQGLYWSSWEGDYWHITLGDQAGREKLRVTESTKHRNPIEFPYCPVPSVECSSSAYQSVTRSTAF